MTLNVSSRDPNTLMELNISIFYRVTGKLHYQIYFVTNTSGTISLIISTPLLYAIFFHSGKTSRDYKSFLVAAQVISFDFMQICLSILKCSDSEYLP